MSKPTDKFWINFAEALRRKGEDLPAGDGWKTNHELAPILGVTPRVAGRKLQEGVRTGIIEHYDGCTFRDGKLKRTSWYRPKK